MLRHYCWIHYSLHIIVFQCKYFWKSCVKLCLVCKLIHGKMKWMAPYMAPSFVPLTVQLSCPLSRKTPPKHNVSTSMFDGGDGVLGVIGSIPPPPNTASWVDAKELVFGLIWPQHFHSVLLWIIGKLQTGLYMCFLEQGDLAGAAGFQPFTA